ncbi:MAG: Uma2 family endonuclease [Vicinamibacterales bacterium]
MAPGAIAPRPGRSLHCGVTGLGLRSAVAINGSHGSRHKLSIYAREGVPYVWLIDPLARTLEALRLEGSRWTIIATWSGLASLRDEPFEALELELSLLWAP